MILPKHQSFDNVLELKLLRDKALFSESEYTQFQSVKALASFGSDAIPIINEIAVSTSNQAINRYCQELLERV